MTQAKVPSMGEFLKDAPSNWGKWGPDDEIGSLNYLTPTEVMRGIRHVKQGKVMTLQRLINNPRGDPVSQGRTGARVSMLTDESSWDKEDAPQLPGGVHYADDYIETFLHGSSHYDALGHVWYDGKIWNGYDARTTVGGMKKASVLPIAEKGVVGRGILLDMAHYRGKAALGKGETFTHEDLKECAASQGTKIENHDILLIRSGFLNTFFEVSREEFYGDFNEPGLTYSLELVRWFQDMEIPNLVTDTIANEVTLEPNTGVVLSLHCALMRNLGVALTEIIDLNRLAEDCAADNQWTFLYVAAPLKVVEGTGSQVNPVVIK
jgi:kynurenine formamidase